MRLLLLALLPACGLYFGSSPSDDAVDAGGGGGGGGGGGNYQLTKTKAIAGEHTIAGVDSDGAGGIWIVYRDQPGDYYAAADVWVTHLDATGAKLSEWHYADDYTQIGGIAYTGDALWLNYNSLGTGVYHLRELEPTDGTTIGTFATQEGLGDITYDGHDLVLSYHWNEMVAMNVGTGAIDWTVSIPSFPEDGTEHGIASVDGNYWIVLGFTNTLYLVDPSGNVIGTATTDLLPSNDDPVGAAGLQLAWDGHALILVSDNQISWLALSQR